MGAESEGNLAEETGEVLDNHLQDGGVGGGIGVELQVGGDYDFEVGRVVEVATGFEQGLDGELARDHVVEIGEEAVAFGGVQLDGAEDVCELEFVDDDAGDVGESSGCLFC
jgi:hypothetical protein